MRVLLTGAAAHLAKPLLPALCAHRDIETVVGVDLAPVPFAHTKFRLRRLDLVDAELDALLAGCDALIHLAFVVLRGRMAHARMRAVNVLATQRLFAHAREAGVRRLIHLSSAAVYGSGENLTEAAPLAPLPGFAYAAHKAELEHWFDLHCPQAVRLRPHVILGPHCQPLLAWLLRQPCYLRLPEPQPLLQCVHEDDVIAAILAALGRNVSGPFNLASEDALSFRAMIRRHHRHALGLPFAIARTALAGTWRLTGLGGEPAWIEGLRHSLTLDCTRAARALDWRPRYDSAAAIDASLTGR